MLKLFASVQSWLVSMQKYQEVAGPSGGILTTKEAERLRYLCVRMFVYVYIYTRILQDKT